MAAVIQEFEFCSIHHQMLRSMVVSWDNNKSPGAPTIEPSMPYGKFDTMVCLARLLGRDPKFLVNEDEMELQNLHRQSEIAFEIFLAHGRLSSGLYNFEDHLAIRHLLLSEATTDIRVRPDTNRKLDSVPTNKAMRFLHIFKNLHTEKNHQKKLLTEKETQSPISTFMVLEDHLKLLRHLNVKWRRPQKSLLLSNRGVIDEEMENHNISWPVVGINPQQPYGTNTDYFTDMGKILEMSPKDTEDDRQEFQDEKIIYKFSDVQQDILRRLHRDMQTVLQIFLQKAEMVTGRYYITEKGWVFEDARHPNSSIPESLSTRS